jgi:hypothetical protein
MKRNTSSVFLQYIFTIPVFLRIAILVIVMVSDISFTSNASAFLSSLQSWSSNISCDGGFGTTIKQRNSDHLLVSEWGADSCDHWFKWIGLQTTDPYMYKLQYDTLRHYIESCAEQNKSYQVFGYMDDAVQEYDLTDTNRFNRFRDWLISVLYLNTTNPLYFCACVESMAHTYRYGPYNDPNASFAVFKYLIDNKQCDESALDTLYAEGLRSRHESWLSGDTTKPEDTTLPSLESIGLGILLQHQSASPSGPLPQQYFGSFTSSPNPFRQETTLEFVLNRMAYITIDVYDVLGHKVWGSDHGSTMDAGTHQVRIDGAGMSSGTYYARISTGFGEVKTVKLVKE